MYCWVAPDSKEKEVIFSALKTATRFGFCIGKEEREPFRHTNIIICFNGIEEFSINRRIPDKTLLFKAAFGAEAETYIEDIEKVQRKRVYSPIIWETTDKEEAEAIIRELLTDPGTWYNLWDKNCRDHVAACVEKAMKDKEWKLLSKEEFLNFVEEVRIEDRFRVLCIAITIFGLLSCFAPILYNLSMITCTACYIFNTSFRDTTEKLVKSAIFQSHSSKKC